MEIANYGEVDATFKTKESHDCSMVFQIAGVERVLVGCTPLAEAGNEVTLRKADGDIRHVATGKSIGLERAGGVCALAMHFLVIESSAAASPATSPPKHRCGRET